MRRIVVAITVVLVLLLVLFPGSASSLSVATPTISGLSPSFGPAPGGTAVVISGTGFTDVTAVTFGGTDATSYGVDSVAQQITAVAPPHAVGTVDVVVTAAGGPSDPAGDVNDYAYLNLYDDLDLYISYTGIWHQYSKAEAYGGSYARSSSSGSSATVYFSGTRLDWIAMMGTTTGKADVYLDDVFQTTIDLSDPSGAIYQAPVWSTGSLSSGPHKVEIVRNSGTASGKYVTLDAVATDGTLLAPVGARYGVDYSHISADWPAFFRALTAGGRDFIGRYLPIQGAIWRCVTTTELRAAAAAGVDCFFWFEDSGNHKRALEGFDAGVADAKEALSALASLGVPPTSPVYYTVDFNNTDGSLLDAYFRGIASVVPVSQIGVYGNYSTIDWLYEHGLATYFCQTTAWLDSRGWHPQAQLHQNTATYMIGGVYVDRLTATTAQFGQYRRYEQSDMRVLYSGAWSTYSTASASEDDYIRANTSGSSVTVWFSGTRLDWIATMGTTTGKADVYLDDEFQKTVDLSHPSGVIYQQDVWTTGTLESGLHSVRIAWNPGNAKGKYVTLDAFDVIGGPLSFPPPTITSLSPSSGSTAGGTTVSITGAGFTDVSSSVTFDGTPAVYSVLDSTHITATAPAHAAGTVDVVVTTAGGSSATAGTGNDYTYTVPASSTRYDQKNTKIVKTGTWSNYSSAAAYLGSYGRSRTKGATAIIYFTGTKIAWIGMKGTTTGLVDVYLDSTTTKTTTINLTATKASHQVILWTSPTLANGSHYLRLVRSSSSGIGKFMTLDAVDIWGTITTGP